MNALGKQRQELKRSHPDKLLLFRMGDFYEFFEDDAKAVCQELGLTLTKRGDMAMAGFPHHLLETHLRKLLKSGHRVAICEPEPTRKI